MRKNLAILLAGGLLALAVACGGEPANEPLPAESAAATGTELPSKGDSLLYDTIDDALNELGNATAVCREVEALPASSRRGVLANSHPTGMTAGWTDAKWAELELAYLSACYKRGLLNYATVVNMESKALDALIREDTDTPAYCAGLKGLSDDQAKSLLLTTHTGPLYQSLREYDVDRIAMYVGYLSVCQDWGLW